MAFLAASPWRWCSATCALLGVAALLAEPSAAADAKTDKQWVYVGTYTGKNSKGIYRFEFDPATGKLSNRALVAETPNPTFLAISPDHRFLYAVNEIGNFKGKSSGAVSAFAIDAKTGELKLLNQQPSGGGGPCHIVIDKQAKHVLVANYGGGSASVLPIDADGKLGDSTAFIQHKGSSVDKGRQAGPHAHCANFDAANKYAFVTDLGLDKVLIYKYDAAKGTLKENDPPSVSVTGGAGPRHLAFHPNGKYAYVINEMGSTMTAMSYDPATGTLKPIETASTLPKEFKGNTSTAEVEVHPSGKFVYGSNRGHDSIVTYAIDDKTGKPTLVGHQGKGIKTPRHFMIDPSGKYLLVGNQNGGSIAVFRIDPKTGELTPTEETVEVGAPVCLVMMPMGK
jgi:6-phosphogluconolactonase